jgi:hypothetical protein
MTGKQEDDDIPEKERMRGAENSPPCPLKHDIILLLLAPSIYRVRGKQYGGLLYAAAGISMDFSTPSALAEVIFLPVLAIFSRTTS